MSEEIRKEEVKDVEDWKSCYPHKRIEDNGLFAGPMLTMTECLRLSLESELEALI